MAEHRAFLAANDANQTAIRLAGRKAASCSSKAPPLTASASVQAVQSSEDAGHEEQKQPSALQPNAEPFVPASAAPTAVAPAAPAPAAAPADAPSSPAGPPVAGTVPA